MNHLEIELQSLKSDIIEIWNITIAQLEKTKDVFFNDDKNLAREVVATEKRINSMELSLDRKCEFFIARFNPNSTDLRFLLAILKINNNLERTADIAEGISRLVLASKKKFNSKLIEAAKIAQMFENTVSMLQSLLYAFQEEQTNLIKNIYEKDELLDEVNAQANSIVEQIIKDDMNSIEPALNILSTVRKLERVGDQCTNIAEEIIFFVEAKIIRHNSHPQQVLSTLKK